MTIQRARDEFYVGYADRAPVGLARFVKTLVACLALGLTATFALVAASQNDLPSGVFEFGVQRDFEGVLHTDPVPHLRMTHPGADGRPTTLNVLLAGFGKRGIPRELRDLGGRKVAFRGSLVYRENLTMIEANAPDSLRVLGPPGADETRRRSTVVGEVALTGELVDTKCWLGVMRPATGKVHRACAVRCLAGGVPPGLLVRSTGGNATVFLLVGPPGESLDLDPEMAARTVEVRGTLELHDGLPVLRVEEIGRV